MSINTNINMGVIMYEIRNSLLGHTVTGFLFKSKTAAQRVADVINAGYFGQGRYVPVLQYRAH